MTMKLVALVAGGHTFGNLMVLLPNLHKDQNQKDQNSRARQPVGIVIIRVVRS